MTDFERLNRETRDWNNGISRNLDPTSSAAKYGTSAYWRNYWNNQTYKQNNGHCSKHYAERGI